MHGIHGEGPLSDLQRSRVSGPMEDGPRLPSRSCVRRRTPEPRARTRGRVVRRPTATTCQTPSSCGRSPHEAPRASLPRDLFSLARRPHDLVVAPRRVDVDRMSRVSRVGPRPAPRGPLREEPLAVRAAPTADDPRSDAVRVVAGVALVVERELLYRAAACSEAVDLAVEVPLAVAATARDGRRFASVAGRRVVRHAPASARGHLNVALGTKRDASRSPRPAGASPGGCRHASRSNEGSNSRADIGAGSPSVRLYAERSVTPASRSRASS